MTKGTTMRRGLAMVAGVALAAAALPGVAAAQDDEIVVMHYFSAELGGAASVREEWLVDCDRKLLTLGL